MELKGKSVLHKLIDENIHYLSSGIEILSLISSDHYICAEESHSPWMSGVGKHFRHLIDFYDRFLDQFPVINYDLRNRNCEIEKNKSAAEKKLIYFIETLQSFKHKDINQEIDLYNGDIPMSQNVEKVISTLGRELRYLIEHTVHHFAIIAMFLKHYGYSVPNGFGIAQSTLDYEARQ